MRLTELNPELVRYETRVEEHDVVDGDTATWRERGCPTRKVTGPREYMIPCSLIDDAQGITFLCPKCFAENRDKIPPGTIGQDAVAGLGVGVHSVQVTFSGRGALDSQGSHNKSGEPSRWDATGDSFQKLTLKPSILVNESCGCGWHGFITDGRIE